MLTDNLKTITIWVLSFIIFLLLCFNNNNIEAYPPQLNYEQIFNGRVVLHIYDIRDRTYINSIINSTFNNRVSISARVIIYSTASMRNMSEREVAIQFDHLSTIAERYINNSTYFLSYSSYINSANHIISPCICSNNYCMECQNNIGGNCAFIDIPNPFCFFEIDNKFSYPSRNRPGIAGFVSGNYYISFMY